MKPDPELEDRLARLVEHQLLHGEFPPIESVCEGRPDLVEPLKKLAGAYLEVSASLGPSEAPLRRVDVGAETDGALVEDGGAQSGAAHVPSTGSGRAASAPLPHFDGFRTIERLGRGGMGEVFKLHDLKLDRVVAAKIIRRDRSAVRGLREFLGEARTLALFQDRRVVQIHEFREDADPPVIIMEFVDGFELGRVAGSLEYRQRAHIVEQVAEAIHHAHQLGIQHRDLKPSNIMVDAALAPKILDFGLSASDPGRGHFRGTLPYVAPEQLDPARPIDARTDVYALGVILYEVLCSAVPFTGATEEQTVAAIRGGRPRLPVEIEPGVPEPLQAISLKAMEADPSARYQSAQEMALDLRRYLDGRPVLARPAVYATALDARIRTHLDHVADWLRLRLIYPHEATRLRSAYHELEVREDDWILSSRLLSYSQITLYIGAFLLVAGALFYLTAYRLEAFKGVVRPFLVLGVPFLGLNLVANFLYRRERRPAAVAFYLGAVALLPVFLMILLHELHILDVAANTRGQLFTDGYLSNHQLQVTIFAACAWACFLAFRTRTFALGTVFTFLLFLMALAVLADHGLRDWVLGDELWLDPLAVHLAPLVGVYAALGYLQERPRRPWLGRPLYVASALTLVLVLELLAWDGKEFDYLGVKLAWFASGDKIRTLHTAMAMALNGIVMYGVALAIERRGPDLMKRAGGLLFTLAPFALLKPLGYLSYTEDYSPNFDWMYLALAFSVCLLARHRQRRSFYYAGLMNVGWALHAIAGRYHWRDKPLWSMTLVGAGLVALGIGYALSVRERNRREAGTVSGP